MIEVITHAECVLRLTTTENYEEAITNVLMGLTDEIVTDKILSIANLQKNIKNHALETKVLAKFTLYLSEEDETKHVEDYVEDIVPFLKRQIPKCNEVISTKIIQMKRVRHT